MSRAANHLTLRYRLAIASRVLAAAVGGYVLTSLLVIVLALIWPIPQAQAVFAATMLSFLMYTVIIMWVFSVGQLRTVWLGMLAAIAIAGLLTWILLPEVPL